ncbi:MAG: hypothetical protein PHN31_04350, partial [Candidatus Gracilibacteria bacterium]|nr:hypothetical protein [Candidatus Gracilibacteria bacterium]
GLSNLYTIGTLFTIFLLGMILKIQGQFMTLSIIGLGLFWISNYTLPFLNKNLVKDDIQNMIIGSVIGIIFGGFYLYKFGIIYFPGTSMGLAFLVFALFYFFGGYILYRKLISTKDTEVLHDNDYNFIYSYLGIAVSLFTISVAFIFSSIPAVICLIWLFQSTLVLYFSKKLNSDKIYYAGVILFLLGIIKYFHYFGTMTIHLNYLFSITRKFDFITVLGNYTGNYFSNYVGNLFILLPIFLNLKFSKKSDINSISFLEVLHVFGVLIFTSSMVFVSLDLLSNLYNITSYKEAIFTIISLLLLIYSLIYNIVGNVVAKSVLMVSIILLCFLHIFSVEGFTIYNYNYLITLIVVAIYLIDYLLIGNNKISNFAGIFKTFLNPLYIYLFLITSIYLYDISYNYFILTIYWGFLSLSFVHIGLFFSNKKFRVSGLIILILTLLKITFYDLWNSIDNGIIRVVAFIFIGALMIYISSIYKSKGLKISDDLLSSDNNNNGYKVKSIYESENTNLGVENKDKSMKNGNNLEKNIDYVLNKKLDKIDIGEKKAVLFIFNDGRKAQIRAKNLIKIGKIILKTAGKNKFEKGELKYTYDYVKKNYKSELSKRDYDKIIEIIDDFVKNGGSFELI